MFRVGTVSQVKKSQNFPIFKISHRSDPNYVGSGFKRVEKCKQVKKMTPKLAIYFMIGHLADA